MYQGRPRGVGRGEHRVPGPGVVVPAAVGLQVQVRQLPDLPRVADPALQPPGLLRRRLTSSQYFSSRIPSSAMGLFPPPAPARGNRPVCSGVQKAHHRLDAGPVVPAAGRRSRAAAPNGTAGPAMQAAGEHSRRHGPRRAHRGRGRGHGRVPQGHPRATTMLAGCLVLLAGLAVDLRRDRPRPPLPSSWPAPRWPAWVFGAGAAGRQTAP